MASNRNALKKYAPKARLDFIQAMTNRAAMFGITRNGVVDGMVQGDLFILNGKAFPRSVAAQRDRLAQRIKHDGFDQVMEAIAYTWFNRFLAIRYMEVHDYFDHGLRVLSHPAGHAEPQILEQVTALDLPGLNRDEIVTLKLDGTKDEDIYRRVIIAQCNDLHRALPFLFERIDDETELLLPSNLLQSDSIVRKLVDEIEESEWNEIEIIGWLYQFYISEKKDQVIGKVVKSEDIPAATQLFTPNWIVKYMVQNSLGAQWLATYPDSPIRGQMEYYIAPAEQTPEVQARIAAITPKQLDPEAITLIDPAVGSGHILVEAYDLFRAIYLERGYTKREAARAILTKNLFGLDIDDRAAQMAGFALLMKACADDRTVLRNPPKLNVLALQDSEGLDADALAKALLPQERFEMVPSGDLLPETLSQPTLSALQPTSKEAKAIKALVTLFDGAKTFGSLITVPDSVMQSLPLLDALLAKPLTLDLYLRQAQEDAQEGLKPLVEQARLLGGRYDCVVANPPYMGGKGMNPIVKNFADKKYNASKSDLMSMFMDRGLTLLNDNSAMAMVTIQNWMFLSSFDEFRTEILERNYIQSLVQIGYNSFPELNSKVVQAAAFTIRNNPNEFTGTFVNCNNAPQAANKMMVFKDAASDPNGGSIFNAAASDFKKIPGSPIAYWAGEGIYNAFGIGTPLSKISTPKAGISTGSNEDCIYFWHEVSASDVAFNNETGRRFIPHNKGGGFRKWIGFQDYVLKYGPSDISRMESYAGFRHDNASLYRNEMASWGKITSGKLSARYYKCGFTFDSGGLSIFGDDIAELLLLLNSKVCSLLLQTISPSLNFTVGDMGKIPVISCQGSGRIEEILRISEEDWASYETSFYYTGSPLLKICQDCTSLASSHGVVEAYWQRKTVELCQLEDSNNLRLISAYRLQDELTPDVPLSEITLTCNPHYRYGGDLNDEEREARLKSDTMRELISYAVGCMMGRYSLAEPGLIYAHSGGVGFDPSRYGSFPTDDDGIIPLTEEQWFADDAAVRIEEFLGIAWPDAPVMETLTTLMDALSMDKTGEPRLALRSYLSKQFYKDHLQTYKNRPIYWLFSSGKQKAFEALVYLHRYNEGTLARIRTNYVSPLMGKLQQRMSDLESDIASSASSAEKARKAKEKDKLGKQLTELRAFDEELRHLADQRIALDLDDGVKVNYGRFGNLLAAKDKVCGKDE